MIDKIPLLLAAALAAPLCWVALKAAGRIAPRDFLASQMREQNPGTRKVRQLGGLAVVPLYLAALAATVLVQPQDVHLVAALGGSAALLWAVGIIDDHRHLPVLPRLAAQLLAAGAVALFLAPSASLFDGAIPWWIERVFLTAALLYFINMANFMDGMDMMSVTGLGIPLLACLFLYPGWPVIAGPLGYSTLVLTAALAGFAILNWPPAKLYLGDNGSLVLGLAAGAICLHLAFTIGFVAAILPFGYYLCDSASTLALRAWRGENILRSHSGHAYQAARRAGRSHTWILVHVLAVNIVLFVLARAAASSTLPATAVLAAIAGAGLSAALVIWFRGQANERAEAAVPESFR